jgi:hypothetical protein
MNRGTLFARRTLFASTLVLLAAALPGCSKSIDGKYVMQGGVMVVELKNGMATLSSSMDKESETAPFVRDGDKVTVKSKMGDVVFTIMKDGSLEGMLGTFKKSAS